MGWVPPGVRQWKSVVSFWARVSCTITTRLNKRIALWAHSKSERCKNWYFCVKKMLKDLGLQRFCDISRPISKTEIVRPVQDNLMSQYINDWSMKV